MLADNSDDIQGDNKLDVVGSRPVSDVWKLYTKLHDQRKAICTIYKREFAYLGGTTNLRNHLSSKHSMLSSQDVETAMTKCRKSSTLDGFVRPTRCSEVRAKNISDRVTHMIVQDPRPIHIVECNGFCDLMKYLEPGYVLPSRKQFTTDINFKHAMCKQRLKEKLGEKAVLYL